MQTFLFMHHGLRIIEGKQVDERTGLRRTIAWRKKEIAEPNIY